MRRVAIIGVALALGACATLGVSTPGQGLYAAYGGYNAALVAATTYATAPGASPAVVAALNKANKAAAPATVFVQAYRACVTNRAASVTINSVVVPCGNYNFSASSVNASATALRDAALALSGELQK